MMVYFGNLPLGRNLHALRRRKRISLARMAELTGVPYLTLYCIENGTLQDIDYQHLDALCTALKITPEALVKEE